MDQVERGLRYAESIAYSSKKVLRFTYEKAKELKDLPGIFCECGVAAGAQIIAMAWGAPDKEIYAFDSFDGIALPSNRDNQMPGIRFLSESEQKALPNPGEQVLESSGATVVSMEDFLSHVNSAVPWATIIPIKGWFEETIPKFCDEYKFKPYEGICLLRLDGDLYNSTFVALKHLYPRMKEGGLVIVDDYALPGCREAVHDYFEGKLPKMEFIKGKDYQVAYWYV